MGCEGGFNTSVNELQVAFLVKSLDNHKVNHPSAEQLGLKTSDYSRDGCKSTPQ